MPRWNDAGSNGKGDKDRVNLKKYFNNYDDINWDKKNKPITKQIIAYSCKLCGYVVKYPKKYGTVTCKCGGIFFDNIGEGLVRCSLDPNKCTEVYESV